MTRKQTEIFLAPNGDVVLANIMELPNGRVSVTNADGLGFTMFDRQFAIEFFEREQMLWVGRRLEFE